jgi:hypothetical protein
MSKQEVIHQWLNNMSKSVAMQDLEKHMSLVSQHVRVYGVPGQKTIDYDGWRMRRKNEFDKDLLARISYKVVRVKTQALRRIAFQVEETMAARTGQAVVLNKDIMLELEPDDKWRVVEEKIRNWNLQE